MTLGNKMELLASELVDRGLEVSNKDGQPLSAKAMYIKADKCDTEARRLHRDIRRKTAAEKLANLLNTRIGGRSGTGGTASHRAGRYLPRSYGILFFLYSIDLHNCRIYDFLSSVQMMKYFCALN